MKTTVYIVEKSETGIKHRSSLKKMNIKLKYLSGVATQIENDDSSKVHILVDVIYDMLCIYGYGDKKSLSTPERKREHNIKTKKDKLRLAERFLSYVKKAGFGSWKDLFKYKINAFFSHFNSQEIPPVPKGLEEFEDLVSPGFLAFGRAKRFIQCMKNDRPDLFESFTLSVALGCKKGAPPVHTSTVKAAEVKTFKHLTSKPSQDQPFEIFDGLFHHLVNKETTCFQLRRAMRELFGRESVKLDRKDLTGYRFPSTSAQYNFGQAGMGAVGAFLNVPEVKDLKPKVKLNLIPVRLEGELSELYGTAGIKDQERIDSGLENPTVKETIGLGFDGKEICDTWDMLYPSLIDHAINEQPNTVVIGLPEPLKVRNITAGPPLTYTVLGPLQKWLWRTLKTLNVFKLIGTPQTEQIVSDAMGILGENEEFISGDYQASTDNLHSWVSECLLDELFNILREKDAKKEVGDGLPVGWLYKLEVLMKRALTGHRILDPERMKEYRLKEALSDDWFSQQQEGQLMGSVISFPFLCIANAALCRWAMEIDAKKNYSLIDWNRPGYVRIPLLINGDDCVFRGSKDLFAVWKSITSFSGLSTSVGKTFRSSKFLQINSTQYGYKVPAWESSSGYCLEGYYHELKYVNLGLIYAQKKSGDRGKNFFDLGALHRDLYRTCPDFLFNKASEMFIREAKALKFVALKGKKDDNIYKNGILCVEQLKLRSLENFDIPYYLPEWLGGLGFVPSSKKDLNAFERMVAGCMRENLGKWQVRGYSRSAKWETHRFVQELLQDYKFLDNQNYTDIVYGDRERQVMSKSYDSLYGLLCMEALFNNGSNLFNNEIKTTERRLADERQAIATFRHNRGLFKNARKQVKKSPKTDWVLSDEDLVPEKKDFSLCCFDMRE